MTPTKIQPPAAKPQPAKAASSESSNVLKKNESHKSEKVKEKDFASELADLDNAEDLEGMEEATVEGEELTLEAKGEELAKALKLNLNGEIKPAADMQAAPVSADDLMQVLNETPAATEPTPKVLDPKLIKQVNEVVLPEGAEQVEATQLQLKDLLLQQEKVPAGKAVGRSPSIDFAKTEVDPQLLNFEDFVAQKNAVTGKAVAPNAYGMPAKTTMNAEQLMGEKAVAANEALVHADTGAATQGQLAPAFALENTTQDSLRTEVSAPSRTFNMQNLTKSQDVDSILTQVSDYIVQAKAAKEPTVQMRVNHQDLGMLDITVSRTANDMVSIVLGTQDNGAKMFLGQNRENLMSHLSQAGVNVSDLKMEQSSNTKDGSTGQNSQQGGQPGERQFGSQENQRREEQQRRHDLWEIIREKEVA
jgi:hypothetical protein